jgi:uncharacterized phage-associated protein
MATASDVAEYILQRLGPVPAMKLQKLVYYAQAWHLVWEDQPLFNERIEAWANGPVVPTLYQKHRGQFYVEPGSLRGDPGALTQDEAESIDSILITYGKRNSQWLSDLTHREAPWQDAREGLQPGDRGDAVITHAAMAEYYGSL